MNCEIFYDQDDVVFTTDIDIEKFSQGNRLYIAYERCNLIETENNFDLRFLVLRKERLNDEFEVSIESNNSFRAHKLAGRSKHNFMPKFCYGIFDEEIIFLELHSGFMYPALDGTKNLPEKINNKLVNYSDKYLYERITIFNTFHQNFLALFKTPSWFIFTAHYLDYSYLNNIILDEDEIKLLNEGLDIFLSEPILTMDVDSIIHEDGPTKNILNYLSDFVLKNNLTNVTVHLCEGNFPKKVNLYPGLTFKHDDIFLKISALHYRNFNVIHHNKISSKFCSPNWIFRPPRYIIASYLSNKNSLISWPHYVPSGKYEYSDIYYNNFEFFRENEPFIVYLRDNDMPMYEELLQSTSHLDSISPVHLDNKVLINNDDNDYTIQTNNGHSISLGEYYMQSFCGIVNETVFDYPFANISEKTLLPILYKRPFILVATREALKTLKDLGFKTFDDIWDESYDTEWSCNVRMYKILKIIKNIENTPLDDLKQILFNLKDRLDYNYNLLMKLYERT